jgi:hypothetical protein
VNLADELRARGLDDVLVEIDGWQGRGTGRAFTPVGVLNHHDAMHDGVSWTRGVEVIRDGHSALSGPLANFWAEDDGRIALVADGNCNHAGYGSSKALARVKAGLPPLGDARDQAGYDNDVVGNTWFYGIEVHNAGVAGDPYESPQIGSLVRLNAALCDIHGWTGNRCWMHRQWTNRKPDMSWRGDLPGFVNLELQHRPWENTVTPEQMKTILDEIAEVKLIASWAVWATEGREQAAIEGKRPNPTLAKFVKDPDAGGLADLVAKRVHATAPADAGLPFDPETFKALVAEAVREVLTAGIDG